MMSTVLTWVGVWLYFVVWFFAVARWLAMKEQGTWDQVPRFFRWSLIAGLVPGLLVDIAYNVVYGSYLFRERPHEWTFSERVGRHVKESTGRDYRRALWWANVLNTIEPGHIKVPTRSVP